MQQQRKRKPTALRPSRQKTVQPEAAGKDMGKAQLIDRSIRRRLVFGGAELDGGETGCRLLHVPGAARWAVDCGVGFAVAVVVARCRQVA